MKINLVTGVAGFIGSHLAETLLNQDKKVIGIDEFNDYYDPKFKQKNVKNFISHPNFTLINSKIQAVNLGEILSEVEIIFHQAAQAGVRASWGEGFRLYTERNLNTTQVLLEAAKNAPNLKRFVYASSSSIYGNAETLPTSETICPCPVSPYGITKLAGEQLGFLYHQNFAIPVTALRYFTVYGPRQRPDMAFHKFFKAILENQPISIYGDGQQTRDFTFISDCIAANLAAATLPAAIGQVFNIGGGSRVSLAEVIDTMETIVNTPIQRNFSPSAQGDARHTSADVSKAKALLNYAPKISLKEGLIQEWEWIKSLYSQR